MKSESDTSKRLDALIRRYQAALIRYAAEIVGDTETGKDVVQDTFMRLWKTGRIDEGDRGLTTWLFRVCRNRALDVRRKERRMNRLSDKECAGRAGGDPSPEEGAATRETAARVAAAIGGLPDDRKELLRLKFQNGLTYRQIAEITGLTVSNVGFRIHTALADIRDMLAKHGLFGRE